MKYKIDRKFVAEREKEFESLSADKIIDWVASEIGFENFILASSMSVEGQVLADMLFKKSKNARIVMIDTGRLNQETYDTADWTRKYYGVNIEVIFPDSIEVEEMVTKFGVNLFYDSVDKRKFCCEIRKINPLKKKLLGLKAWMTGLKRIDNENRTTIRKLEWDEKFNLLKLNPIADWTDVEIWNYLEKNKIKINQLYKSGYKSIGCACCTRPVREGEDARAGRWWWEDRAHSECGLHIVNGKLVRKNIKKKEN